MTDTLVLDIPTTAGQAAIATLMDDDVAPQPGQRRVAGTRPLETAKVLTPTVDVPDSFNIDEWIDHSILDPFAIDWDAMEPVVEEAKVLAPLADIVAAPPRRLSRDERRKADLEDRLQAMRSQMAEVKLRVAMFAADPSDR